MRLDSLLRAAARTPWAIAPEKLDAICALLELRANGQHVPDDVVAAVKSDRRAPLAAAGGAVAVIPVFGVIAPRMNLMTEFSGGTSAEQLAKQIESAVDNAQVTAVVLDVDSPGGSVGGMVELSDRIYSLRGKKPIVAVANHLMASAAYCIASAADEIVAAPSAEVGSIGCYMLSVDVSGADEKAGIARTLIKAGRFKAEDLPFFPLTDDARVALQETVDAYYAQFVNAVARNRGTTPAAVRSGYGQGRALVAASALSAGLIDRIATLDQVISELAGPGARAQMTRAAAPAPSLASAEVQHGRLVAMLEPAAADAPMCPDCGTPMQMDGDGDYACPNCGTTMPADDPPDEMMPTSQLTATAPAGDAALPSPAPGAPASSPPSSTPSIRTAPRAKETIVSDTTTAHNRADPTDERAREREILEISALADAHAMHDALPGWISANTPLEGKDGVRAQIAAKLQERITKGPQTRPRVDLSEREQRTYSYARAIVSALDGTASFERDLHEEIAKKLPTGYKPQGGFFLPTTIAFEMDGTRYDRAAFDRNGVRAAGLDTATSTKGAELKYTQYGGFIEMLRNRARVIQAGARMLQGLDGPVTFTKQNGAGTFTWVGENPGSDVADSNLLLTTVSLSAKTGQSTTSYSRQLLRQAVEDVEALVRDDLAAIHALGIDAGALYGTGSSNQPTGVFNQSGIGVVALATNGAAPTYNNLINQQVQVAQANAAAIGTGAYITTPGMKGTLQTTSKLSNTIAQAIWSDDDTIANKAAFETNQVQSNLTKGTGTNLHAIYYGIWQQLMIGEWGAMEILVDPLRLKKQGMIEVTSFQMIDIAVRYAAAFSVIKDAISSF